MANVDINSMIVTMFSDIHNTMAEAQQAIKALKTAADSTNAQALKVGALLDALTADAADAKLVIEDADGVVKSVKLPWLLRK